ncbi:MAG: carotenoid biosynthesis protein [Mycobacteriales bacterium]
MATVIAQIGYPLAQGPARDRITVVTVLLFFMASATHAFVWRGPRWGATFVAISAGTGFAVEALGVHTGVPFGHYTYRHTLGPELAGVPLVIPLAWAMMAYPALLVGQRIARSPALALCAAAAALASWDLFLDPQMVAAGHWVWRPGVPALLGIPLENDVGWLLAALALMALLARFLPRPRGDPADDRVPLALYGWTYASSVLANLAFFDRPGVALVGGVGMGIVVALWARSATHR